jgi:hypothetical protein
MLWRVERRGAFFKPVRKFIPTGNRTWEVLLSHFTTTTKALICFRKLRPFCVVLLFQTSKIPMYGMDLEGVKITGVILKRVESLRPNAV